MILGRDAQATRACRPQAPDETADAPPAVDRRQDRSRGQGLDRHRMIVHRDVERPVHRAEQNKGGPQRIRAGCPKKHRNDREDENHGDEADSTTSEMVE